MPNCVSAHASSGFSGALRPDQVRGSVRPTASQSDANCRHYLEKLDLMAMNIITSATITDKITLAVKLSSPAQPRPNQIKPYNRHSQNNAMEIL